MASLKKILEAAARDEFSARAPHLDEYVRRLTEAEEAYEAGDLIRAQDFLCYLNSYGDLFAPLTLAATRDADLENPPAYTVRERRQLDEPRRTNPRPPTLF